MTQPMITTNKRRRPLWRTILFTLLSVIGLWYVGLSIGVYTGSWQGHKTQAVLRVTPLPAAFVGWKPLSYADFLDQRRAIHQYTAYINSTTSGVFQQSMDDVPAVTLTKMVRYHASLALAQTMDVHVTDADVHQAYQSQLLQNGNADQVTAQINTLYGWTPELFQRNVIRPAVVRNKIQEKLSFDTTLSAAALRQAQQVLTFVKEGKEAFTDLAKKYSEDVYGVDGGDLGWVNQGEQTKEIDDAAFSLELNTTSDLIHTKYGFHIIKPIERRTENGQEQVHLLMITVLAPQVDARLTADLQKRRILLLVPGLQWDKQNTRVTTR